MRPYHILLSACVLAMVPFTLLSVQYLLVPDVHSTDECVDEYTEWAWYDGHWYGPVKVRVGGIEDCQQQRLCRTFGKCSDWRFYMDGDPWIKSIADQIHGMSDDGHTRIMLTCVFVHRIVTYASDGERYGVFNYRQYPMETLLYRQGDCEDISILCASILRAMGYDAYALSGIDHCKVYVDGIVLDPTAGKESVGGWEYMPCTEMWSHYWLLGMLAILCFVLAMARKGWK